MGPQTKNIVFRVRRRLPDCLLGSRALTWLESGTVSRGAVILPCFAWWLSFPTWEVVLMGYLAVYTYLRNVADR
jgi:hypothetical protein